MAAETVPASVPTNGTTLVLAVPTIADIDAGPTVAELTDPTVTVLSKYITGDGLNPETTENNVEDPRLHFWQVFEQRGDYTDSLEITYVFNPASPQDNEAQLVLTAGTKTNIVIRWAMPTSVDIEPDQYVDIIPVEAGIPRKQPPTRNGVHRITQKLFVVDRVVRDVKVQAD